MDAHMEVMDAAMGAAQQYPDPGKERNIPGMDPNAPPAPQVDWVKLNNGVGLFITSAESPWFFFFFHGPSHNLQHEFLLGRSSF